jgi:hypothetical protein
MLAIHNVFVPRIYGSIVYDWIVQSVLCASVHRGGIVTRPTTRAVASRCCGAYGTCRIDTASFMEHDRRVARLEKPPTGPSCQVGQRQPVILASHARLHPGMIGCSHDGSTAIVAFESEPSSRAHRIAVRHVPYGRCDGQAA